MSRLVEKPLRSQAVGMPKDTLICVLTFVGAGLPWWPAFIEPSIDLPLWLLATAIASVAGLASALAPQNCRHTLTLSALGLFAGLLSASVLFPPSDGIARSYLPIVIPLITIAGTLVAAVAGLLGRLLPVSARYRGVAWLALTCAVLFGPIALALRPPLLARRDRLTVQRFQSLKIAAEIVFRTAGASEVCDGDALRKRYSGPSFSHTDWQRMTANYVRQDGHVFMVHCKEKGGYTIDTRPARSKVDGTRYLCTDESGKVGCELKWNRSRNVCSGC